MPGKSNIAWTNATWNPVIGCSKVSEGCRNCYAINRAHRIAGTGNRDYQRLTKEDGGKENWTGVVRWLDDRLPWPIRRRTPLRIFVNSMSDLFHPDVPDKFLDKVFAVMAMCPHHQFQITTKRPERMKKYLEDVLYYEDGIEDWYDAITGIAHDLYQNTAFLVEAGEDSLERLPLKNVWLGVSIEDQATADQRIPLLLETPAAIRWVSAEPLLGPVNLTPYLQSYSRDGLNKKFLNWVVVGGESGPNARLCEPDWVWNLKEQCRPMGCPFFFKQWSQAIGSTYKAALLDGQIYHEYPNE